MSPLTHRQVVCLLFAVVLAVEANASSAAPPATSPSSALPAVPTSRIVSYGPESAKTVSAQPEPVSSRPFDGQLDASPTILKSEAIPIDLESAFRLAGVDNPEIRIASQRVAQALAERQFAAAQILPTMNAGTNYYNHTGNLQQSDGNILAVNRSALYAGSGAFAVGSGTVNIPGVVWNTNVSVAIFSALKARQTVLERQAGTITTRNDILLQVAVAYLGLMRAEQGREIAVQIRQEAHEVARLTANYAETGQGRKADADRAATEFRQRDTDVLMFESDVLTASARLAQLLNLDSLTRLHTTDTWAIPRGIVPDAISLQELIAMALMQRPELAERRAAIQRALLDLNGAKLLPFSPNVIVGFSAGTFGGGSNLVTPTFSAFDGRTDFDAVAYWSLQNLAVGNRALIDAAASRYNISNLEQLVLLNRVRSEVASAYARTQARYAQIAINERAVKSGLEGFREDFLRIRGREGLPIEVLNNLQLLARARMEYLAAIIEYNRAEFELYVALGQPPASALARPIPLPPPNPNARPPQP